MAKYAKFFSVGGGAGPNGLQLPLGTVLDATLRQVQDGTGTGSSLYLSTGSVRIGTTAASAMYWDNTNNRLGIGTNAPILKTEIQTSISGDVSIITSPYWNLYLSSQYTSAGMKLGVNGASSGAIIQGTQSPNGTLPYGLMLQPFGGNTTFGTLNDLSAKVAIRGSGSTSATTSLLVQNSAGSAALTVKDDKSLTVNGAATFDSGLNNKKVVISSDPSNSYLAFTGDYGGYITASNYLYLNPTGTRVYINDSWYLGNISLDTYGSKGISGAGNQGLAFVSNAIDQYVSGFIFDQPYAGSVNSPFGVLAVRYNGSILFNIKTTGNVGIGTSSPTARLQVQGSGSTSATTSLLVQNSLGTTSLSVNDASNVLIGTTTDNGFKLNVNGSINISGGNKLNFNNGSSQCWITTAGGGTGPSSRSILLPGSGGGGDFIFYNDGPYGIRITESGGDTLVMSPGNSSVTGIMSINKSAASGYGGGTFIYYQSVFGNRMYTFGNPNNERGDEGGSHAKIAGGAAGFLGNGGHVYLEAGAKGTQVGSVDGNIIIAATRGNVAIGTSSPTAKTHIVGAGSTSGTTSFLVQNSSGTTQLSVRDDGVINGVNNKLEISNSGNQLIIKNPAVGNYFYIGPSNSCGVDNSFITPILYAGSLSIESGLPRQGSKVTLGNFLATNTGTNYGLQIHSAYTNNGAGGPNYGKQVLFYDNLTPNNIQLDMTFAYVNPTINYQGTANGAVVGYDFNPTITAVTANTTIRAFQSSTGGVYINTTSYNASAILQADSTTQGFLPPRVTTAQKNAISLPANGLMVYDTDLARPCFFNGATWTTL